MGPYDSSLQMFVQTPRELDMNRLEFMRWLAEANRLEHRIAGPSAGPLVAEGGTKVSPEQPLASALARSLDGATKFTADLGGRYLDGVQPGNWGEGSQFMRRR